jgi:hypothetical protein
LSAAPEPNAERRGAERQRELNEDEKGPCEEKVVITIPSHPGFSLRLCASAFRTFLRSRVRPYLGLLFGLLELPGKLLAALAVDGFAGGAEDRAFLFLDVVADHFGDDRHLGQPAVAFRTGPSQFPLLN